MDVLDICAILMLSALSLGVLYLYALAGIALTFSRHYDEPLERMSYLLLVPAHNEEAVITQTLRTLGELDTTDKLEIAVIADNCSDRTAELARQFGVTVRERRDTTKVGKGYTLEWGLAQYDISKFDAVIIIDADTLVRPNMLEAFTQSFASGAGAVQLYYGMTVERRTPLSYLQQMANIAENIFFYRGRAIAGLPILLRGTGMAIRTDVLKLHPWKAHSVTEDVEYAVDLLAGDCRIDFNDNSAVYAAGTSSYRQSDTQKTRWAAGTFELIGRRFLPLLRLGLASRRFKLVELACSLFLLSRPTLAYLTLIPLALTLFMEPGLKFAIAVWACSLILMLILYVSGGIIFMDNKRAGMRALLSAPFYAVWYLVIQIKAFMRRGKIGWRRTERELNG